MRLHRPLLVLVLGPAVVAGALAQAPGSLRWPGGGMGLKNPELTLNLQPGYTGPSPMERQLAPAQPQGVKLVGRSVLLHELGVYGRMGLGSSRGALSGAGPAGVDAGVHYGVGLSWDLTPRASAVLGWDTYDVRGAIGDRDVRATSLGLQWRY